MEDDIKIVSLKSARDGKHKYIAEFADGRKTRFGAQGMDDFTLTKNKAQREQYRKRHKKDLKTGDPHRAGFLSYYILWGDSTSIKKNVEEFNKKF